MGLQLLVYRIPELPFGKLLLRVRTGVGKAIFPVAPENKRYLIPSALVRRSG
jgi:hypothetical protein